MSLDAAAADGPPAITNLDELRALLQAAIGLEHTTIPPYLVALYSIKEGNAEAQFIIKSVVMEEMLHMLLAANVLNAVGGQPLIDDPAVVPKYPATLPVGRDTPVIVDLRRFSPEAIATFLEVEYPRRPTAEAAAAAALAAPLAGYIAEPGRLAEAIRSGELYPSIGDFYETIQVGLARLEAEAQAGGGTIFTGDPARQLGEDAYFGGGGNVFVVTDLATAQAAIREIVDQGEGYGDTIGDGDDVISGGDFEVAHYYRFNQIARGRRYGPGDKPDDEPSGDPLPVDFSDAAVWPMIDNPSPEQYADPALVAASNAFDVAYTELLRALQRAFNGEPAAIFDAMAAMGTISGSAAELIATPIAGQSANAGPAFRYVPA